MEINTNKLVLLESRLAAAEGEMARMKHRVRATWTCALIGTIGAVVLGASPEARAQFGVTLASLNTRLTATETKNTQQDATLVSLQTQIDNIELTPGPAGPAGATGPQGPAGTPADLTRVVALEDKTQFLSVSEGEMFVTGTNLHVRDGSGGTGGAVNGLGNLIVGYNELRGNGNDNRTGSHNLIVGVQNNYTSYGGIVAGRVNTISGVYASVTGGQDNTASAQAASVTGGQGNTASAVIAWVGGGGNNAASASFASVSGGFSNSASGVGASISGGSNRIATGESDWVAGALFQDF